MLAEVSQKPGAKVYEEPRITRVDVPSERAIYFFTKPGHFAHPSVVIRTQEPTGWTTRGYTSTHKAVFDNWLASFLTQVGNPPTPTQAEIDRVVAAIEAQAKPERDAAAQFAKPDTDLERVPAGFPHRPSAWRMAEKSFFEGLLKKQKYDVLVVPFQVQQYAFSRDIRSLMTGELTHRLASDGASIPDPYLVARAMGEGERRYELAEIFRFANEIGVKRIVAGYVGHDEKQSMRVTIHYYDRGEQPVFSETYFGPRRGSQVSTVPSDRLHSRHFENIAYSDERNPIDAYYAVLPDILRFLGTDPSRSLGAVATSRLADPRIPAAPLAMVTDKAEPVRDAYYFQLLAALTPAAADRTRERFNEKSLLAINQISPKSPDYRALRARALMNLGLRPAALHALGKPTTPEEKHLFGMLNGNLPEVQRQSTLIAPGMKAFIAALEENALATDYSARTKEDALARLARFKLPGDDWAVFGPRAFDPDWWAQHSNLELKVLLDREFPIEGFTAKSIFRGAAALGDIERMRSAAELSVLDHVRRRLPESFRTALRLSRAPSELDYLDLVEGIATDNVLRRATVMTRYQGLPDQGLQYLARIEGIYKDHPRHALARAEAQLKLSEQKSGAEQGALRRSAYLDAFNAAYWEQGQTDVAIDAVNHIAINNRRSDFGSFDNFYVRDYPFRPSYPYWQFAGSNEQWMLNALSALRNSTSDFEPVRQIEHSLGTIRREWSKFDEVLGSLQDRFVGHPLRTRFMADASLRVGDRRAAEAYYREAIKAQTADGDVYIGLGTLLFEEGALGKAANVFLSYPGVKNPSSVDAVGLSNYAHTAASLFYWVGAFEQAIPLYKLAAGLDTGSHSSMTSEIRLALIDRDYPAALRGSLQRAQRYQSSYGYSDYLSLLHAMNHSKEAWDGFALLTREMDEPHVWESALVGHRLQGAGESEIAAWISHGVWRDAGSKYAYAPMYLLRAGITDRMPSEKLSALIGEIERPVWQFANQYRTVGRATADGKQHVGLGPDAAEDNTFNPAAYRNVEKLRVKSELRYFAEGYRAIRTSDFDSARRAFQDASALYDFRRISLGYLLPYYAFAAAKSGDTTAVEKTLQGFDARYQRFDYHLAKAVIAGIGGDKEDSLRHLTLAMDRRLFTDQRPVLVEYQYAELCEWLYESTKDERYREAALRTAKSNQVTQPWFGWSYAMEAELTSDPIDRSRAIAMTYYLDKESERLAKIPAAEVQSAIQKFTGLNPFLHLQPQRRELPI